MSIATMISVSAMSISVLVADSFDADNIDLRLEASDEVMRTKPYDNVPLSELTGDDSEKYFTFNTDNTDKYAKVWLENDSSGNTADLYTVYITTPNGKSKNFAVTGGGGQNYVVFNPTIYGIGTYYVTISNNNSYGFTGLVSVRISPSELN